MNARILKLILLAAVAWVAAGQEDARLRVLVTDTSGAVVPGAEIHLFDAAHGVAKTEKTNRTGECFFDFLGAGSYRLEASKTGFEKYSIESLEVHGRDSQTVKVNLLVAAASKTEITVKGEYEGLPNDSSTGSTITGDYANSIPVNSRSLADLVRLTPGVVSAGSPDGGLNVNGLRSNTNYYTVDGVSANTGIGGPAPAGLPGGFGGLAAGTSAGTSATGSTSSLISFDAMQELRVQTSTFAPEFGRSPGAQISIVSRGGSNAFHGSLSEYYRDDRFNANDWFSNRSGLMRGKLKLQNEGATLGGPIRRNRTFFFISFEGQGLTQPRTAVDTVPDLASRLAAKAALKPFLNAFPIPNGAELGSGAALFNAVYSTPSSNNAGSIRLDHNFGDGRNAFLRYNYAPSDNSVRGGFLSASNNVQHTSATSQTLTGSYSWLNKEQSLNDLRVNFTRSSLNSNSTLDTFGGAVVPADSILFPSGYSSANASYSLNIQGAEGFSKGQKTSSSQDQFNAVFAQSVSEEPHEYKAGFDYRVLLPSSHSNPYSANVTFNGIQGDSSSGALLSGEATNAVVTSSPAEIASWYQNFAFYVQDTWKATDDTTITFGFRYDVNPAPGGRAGTKAPALDSSYNINTEKALYATKWFNIAPRFGISRRLNDSETHPIVFHGGIGIFYDTGYGTTSGAFSGPPNTNTTINSSVAFPLSSTVLAAPALPPTKPYGMVTSADPNLAAPLVYQWNATVDTFLSQGQAVTIGYVGTAGRRLVRQQSYPGFFSDQYQLLNYSTNGGDSDYNALQAQYRKRIGRSFTAQASYTWSHSLDTASNDLGGGGFAILLGSERGSSDFDIRHTFNGSVNWRLPETKIPVLKWVVDGWSLSGIVTGRTGLPFDVQSLTTSTSSSATNKNLPGGLGGFFSQVRPDYVGGQPIWISDPSAPGGKRLNKNAFSTPSSNKQGDLGRNSIRGFGQYQADLALQRQFSLPHRANLSLRLEAFNALNHPLFADPSRNEGANLASANFGVATRMVYDGGPAGGGLNLSQSAGAPRSVQASVRLRF
jgi:hypothetical protein